MKGFCFQNVQIKDSTDIKISYYFGNDSSVADSISFTPTPNNWGWLDEEKVFPDEPQFGCDYLTWDNTQQKYTVQSGKLPDNPYEDCRLGPYYITTNYLGQLNTVPVRFYFNDGLPKGKMIYVSDFYGTIEPDLGDTYWRIDSCYAETDDDGKTYYTMYIPSTLQDNFKLYIADGEFAPEYDDYGKVVNTPSNTQISVNAGNIKTVDGSELFEIDYTNGNYSVTYDLGTTEVSQHNEFPTEGGLRVYLKSSVEPRIWIRGLSRSNRNPNVGTPMKTTTINNETYYYYDFGKYVGWDAFKDKTDSADVYNFTFDLRIPGTDGLLPLKSTTVTKWNEQALATDRTLAQPHDLIFEYDGTDINYVGWGPDKDYMQQTADALYDKDIATTYTLVTDVAINGKTEFPMTPSRHRLGGTLDGDTWTVFLNAKDLPDGDIKYYIKGSNGDAYRPSTADYEIYAVASKQTNNKPAQPLILVNGYGPETPIEYGSIENCKTTGSTNWFKLSKSTSTSTPFVSYTISLNAGDLSTTYSGHPYGPYSVSEDVNVGVLKQDGGWSSSGFSAKFAEGLYLAGNIVLDNPLPTSFWGYTAMYNAYTNQGDDYKMVGDYDNGYSKTIGKPQSNTFSSYELCAYPAVYKDYLNPAGAHSYPGNYSSAKGGNWEEEENGGTWSFARRAKAGKWEENWMKPLADWLIRPQVQDGHEATALEGGVFCSVDKNLKVPYRVLAMEDESDSRYNIYVEFPFTNLSQSLSLMNVDDNLYDSCTVWIYPAESRYKVVPKLEPYIVGPATSTSASFPTLSANDNLHNRQTISDLDADDANALDKQNGMIDSRTKTINFQKINSSSTPASRKFVRNGDGVNYGDGDYYAYVDFQDGGANGLPFRFVMNKTYYLNYGEDDKLTDADTHSGDTQYKNHIYENKQTTPTDVTTDMNSTEYNSTDNNYGAKGQNILWKLGAGKRLVRLHLGDGTESDPSWYSVVAALPMLNVDTIYSGSTGAKFGTVNDASRTIGSTKYNYVTSWASDLAFKLPADYDEYYVTNVTTNAEKKKVVAKLKLVSGEGGISYIPANTGVLLMTTKQYNNDTLRYHHEVMDVYDSDPYATYTTVDNKLSAIVNSQTFAYHETVDGKDTYNYLFGYYAPQGTTQTSVPNKVYYLGFWRQKPGEATASSSNMARLIIGEDINPWWTEIGNLLQVDTEGAAKDMPYITFELDDSDPVADAITDIPAATPAHSADALYTLQGVRVEKAQQRGIYIRNGKKIVIR